MSEEDASTITTASRVVTLLKEVADAENALNVDQTKDAVMSFIADLEKFGILDHGDVTNMFLESAVGQAMISEEALQEFLTPGRKTITVDIELEIEEEAAKRMRQGKVA